MLENDRSLMRFLQAAAYVSIAAWGIRNAANVLSLILIALLIANVLLPFPRWLIRRFHFSKNVAIILTVGLVAIVYFFFSASLIGTGILMQQRLPVYGARMSDLHQQFTAFLNAHGIIDNFSAKSMYNSEQLFERSQVIVPILLEYLSQRVLVWILAWIFVAKLVDAESAESPPVAHYLFHWGKDVHHFIAISAKTGAINGLFNLVVFAAVGVDFPVLWCVLYFFLSFIPTFGFLIAMVPPTFLALLMLGWKRALLVAGGMILVQMLGDYVITPMFMSKGLNISLLDILLSLMIWGYLLGPAGVVLAVPLTIAVKKIFQQQRGKAQAAATPAPS